MFRPRVLVYTGILWVDHRGRRRHALAARAGQGRRDPRPRGDGRATAATSAVENVYRLQIMNTDETRRSFTDLRRADCEGLELTTRENPRRVEVGAVLAHGAGAHQGEGRRADPRVRCRSSSRIEAVRRTTRAPLRWSSWNARASSCHERMRERHPGERDDECRPQRETVPWYREPWPWLLMSGPATRRGRRAWSPRGSRSSTRTPSWWTTTTSRGSRSIARSREQEAAARFGIVAELQFSDDGSAVRVHRDRWRDAPPQQLALRLVARHARRLDQIASCWSAPTGGWYEAQARSRSDSGALDACCSKTRANGWRLTGGRGIPRHSDRIRLRAGRPTEGRRTAMNARHLIHIFWPAFIVARCGRTSCSSRSSIRST